jgi:hypothetical protein
MKTKLSLAGLVTALLTPAASASRRAMGRRSAMSSAWTALLWMMTAATSSPTATATTTRPRAWMSRSSSASSRPASRSRLMRSNGWAWHFTCRSRSGSRTSTKRSVPLFPEDLPTLVASRTTSAADWFLPHAFAAGISSRIHAKTLVAFDFRMQFHGADPSTTDPVQICSSDQVVRTGCQGDYKVFTYCTSLSFTLQH